MGRSWRLTAAEHGRLVGPAADKGTQAGTAKPATPYRSKLEARYAQRLELLRVAGLIDAWHYEPVKFRLGKPGRRCWYTIDFVVVTRMALRPGHDVEYHAVTAYTRDDARVKVEAVANLYPWCQFAIAREADRCGTWVIERI